MLQSESHGSLCAVAFTVIEDDVVAFSPGRAAALGVRGGFAEGGTSLFSTFTYMYHILTERASRRHSLLPIPYREVSGIEVRAVIGFFEH